VRPPSAASGVVRYQEPLREHFARLNRQWIGQYFQLEPADLGQEAGYARADIEMELTLQ